MVGIHRSAFYITPDCNLPMQRHKVSEVSGGGFRDEQDFGRKNGHHETADVRVLFSSIRNGAFWGGAVTETYYDINITSKP